MSISLKILYKCYPIKYFKCFRGLQVDGAQVSEFESILSNRYVSLSHKEDRIRWSCSKTREYQVKLHYKVKYGAVRKKDWPTHLFWNKSCLPKVGVFTWLDLQRNILTKDRLKLVGFQGPNRCPLCKDNEELGDHLLLSCSYTDFCWKFFISKLNWNSPLLANLRGYFKCNMTYSIIIWVI